MDTHGDHVSTQCIVHFKAISIKNISVFLGRMEDKASKLVTLISCI